MNYSVLRKLLSTASVLAVAASMTACSGDMERFGAPGSGFTSNQNDIFTNSVQKVPVQAAYNQPMPAVVTPVQVGGYQAPIAQAPVYTSPAAPVASVAKPAAVSLVTNSIRSPSASVGSGAYAMPAMPSSSMRPVNQPTYVNVKSPPFNYQTVAAVSPSVAPQVLSGPPVVISSFNSLPKSAPKPKSSLSFAQVNSAYGKRLPVAVPVASTAAVPAVYRPVAPVTIASFSSLPKRAPKSRKVDYFSTASIGSTASVPVDLSSKVAVNQNAANKGARYGSAPVSVSSAQPVGRTSGRWTSTGGSLVKVGFGEDLDTLSRRYGVPSRAIAEVNGLPGQGYVVAGQSIIIPVYGQATQANYSSSTKRVSAPVPPASIAQPMPTLPIALRVPKDNPLRQRSQTPYGRQIVKLQQDANQAGQHMVMPGDTLGAIASRYQISTNQLARANGLTVNSKIRMGQRLRIPQKVQQPMIDYTTTASINNQVGSVPVSSAVVPVSSAASAAVMTQMPKVKPQWVKKMAASVSQPKSSGSFVDLPQAKSKKVAAIQKSGLQSNVRNDASATNVAPKQDSNKGQADTQSPKFRWPVRGRIISSFGRKANGEKNDGINLAVPIGTSIRVAESGTVVHAGNKLRGYGNLVLVRHANGWVTAYAHNDKLLVTEGQQVRRGQIIAQAGKSGNVESPQLHFELRIKNDPVDPVRYLVNG